MYKRQDYDSIHNHASLLLEQEVDVDTISRRLGHADSKITKEIYEKLLPFFALSPIDKEELEQAFLINQIGPERFQTHMEIKRILEMSTSTLYQTDDSP